MPALSFGARGTIVMIQRCGRADLLSTTERTWPVTEVPPDLTAAVLPLNCAIRKRGSSFWLVVSNVNMKPSSARATIAVYCYPCMKMRNRRSTAVQLRRACGQRGSLRPSAALFRRDRQSGSGKIEAWISFWCPRRLRCLRHSEGVSCRARNMLLRRPRKHRFHLGLQRRGVERLDDVVADPGLLGGNDVFGL